MYQGTKLQKICSSKFPKSFLLLFSIFAMSICMCNTTLAYIITEMVEVENTFIPGKVSCSIEETIKDGVKNNVKIQNTGNINAYIRTKVNVIWRDEQGNVYGGSMPEKNIDYTVVYENGTGWTKEGDYWYYNQEVEPSKETEVLIKTCSLLNGAEIPSGYHLSVEIIADAVQVNAVEDAWGYDLSVH